MATTDRGAVAAVELRGLIQLPRLAWNLPHLLSGPRGEGARVIVLPGRNAGDVTTAPLRAYLRVLGYRPEGWAIGENHGRVDELIPQVVSRVRAVASERGGSIPLVGQSLGGYIAREVARLLPDEVARVVTLGTPIFSARSPGPITCPVTAIYSRSDQVVSTERSIDTSASTENIEVSSPHFTMGIDPDVWRIVATALASSTSTPPRFTVGSPS